MTEKEQTVLMVKGFIFDLPPTDRDACLALIGEVRAVLSKADPLVATLALSLIGAEEQAKG